MLCILQWCSTGVKNLTWFNIPFTCHFCYCRVCIKVLFCQIDHIVHWCTMKELMSGRCYLIIVVIIHSHGSSNCFFAFDFQGKLAIVSMYFMIVLVPQCKSKGPNGINGSVQPLVKNECNQNQRKALKGKVQKMPGTTGSSMKWSSKELKRW